MDERKTATRQSETQIGTRQPLSRNPEGDHTGARSTLHSLWSPHAKPSTTAHDFVPDDHYRSMQCYGYGPFASDIQKPRKCALVHAKERIRCCATINLLPPADPASARRGWMPPKSSTHPYRVWPSKASSNLSRRTERHPSLKRQTLRSMALILCLILLD